MSTNWIDTRITWAKPPDIVWQILPGGPEALNAQSGEAWEFMGTADGTVHTFRHRDHPIDNGRHVVDVTVATPHRITRHVVR
jgi:hypothetical protein